MHGVAVVGFDDDASFDIRSSQIRCVMCYRKYGEGGDQVKELVTQRPRTYGAQFVEHQTGDITGELGKAAPELQGKLSSLSVACVIVCAHDRRIEVNLSRLFQFECLGEPKLS